MERSVSHTFAGTSHARHTCYKVVQNCKLTVCALRCEASRSILKGITSFLSKRPATSGHKKSFQLKLQMSGNAQPAGAFTAPTDPLVQKQVDRAADIVTDLMEEVNKDLFVATAVADITREAPEVTERDAIKAAVEKRIDSLDEFFVATLRLFAQAASEQSNHDLAERLGAIEEEVLAQVAKRLPAELRVLDAVQRLTSSEERVDLLRRAASGAAADVSMPAADVSVPACQLSSLQTIANQVIDDMEDKEAVPDKQLLARLCLIREELSVVAAEQGSDSSGSAFAEAKVIYQRLIPQGTAARALLKKALDEGFEDSSKARRPRGTEAVRPGRLLTCLTGMQRELAAQGNAANQPILNRLEELRLATLQLLASLAYDS
ncbi:hypothetical protein COCSUDRAFT_46328 [Coccomyxa subellipsoidea C-169]|uniref:Uncharacterized protein n=1 Tax=Coccomyxa subellipsoidea (strain C-169) TaxID=574566 RepID=I0Z4V3_COCSC|nr:hypothetical protein COCSUDRAFT_46328 [Coccomyxa subellipsoidea C-169]EIE25672.1 hypothetical protein COCSUDRAFT_46328 [Coccomyxa subellipsoidea C-169]|eukprot:XP_005650216.1 hypothetical protein COCSUDRAFT_46328 [Coccomyxa subellipsoidea C-169]